MNESTKRLQRRLALLVGAVILSACSGQNLFSLAASTGGTEPQIDITAPVANFSLSTGDSILVNATVTAAVGGATAQYNGWYTDDGTAAFTPETEQLNGLPSVNLSNYLRAVAGQVPGDAVIVLTVTDNAGGMTTDSVKVTIN